jgi:integration host factor subunit beta
VDIFFDAIVARLERGGRVELRGFGAMTTRPRDARIGRNPRNGARVDVPPKRVVHFKPGKPLWLRINASGSDDG